ncbi:hypothetical protein C2E23DRAFT_888040 [Lenzites betulinus]|nr:hypothetical protein C2E23DRAFT_888040 [Lenzites betulinus]
MDATVAQSQFFRALNAPYVNPPPPPPPRPLTPPSYNCRAYVDWRERPSLVDAVDSSDDEEDEMDTRYIPSHLRFRYVYVPIPALKWTQGHSLTDDIHLSYINVHEQYTTSLIKGKIDDQEVISMCKSWSRESRSKWEGFFCELELYRSPRYLWNLQGKIVPKMINLYNGDTAISLLMAPPHTSFWMEASADMPHTLKKAVVKAYVDLHYKNILHGEAELRNMLIGGDLRVTLVNFHAARVHAPVPDLEIEKTTKGALGIGEATQRDLEMELRRVMYKLDYEGARSREDAKRKRFLAVERTRLYRLARGPKTEEIALYKRAGIPSPDVWKTQWINDLDAAPRRHVVPGQPPDELERCLETFRALIEAQAEADAREAISPIIPLTQRRSSSSPPQPPPSAQENPRKRKADPSEDDSEQAPKRARDDKDAVKPASRRPPMYPYTTKVYGTRVPDRSARPRAASTQTAEASAIRVRDFAYEPYDGPRGYYVPHPPTEAQRDLMRVIKIRNDNAKACGRLGLPYFRWDCARLEAPFKRRVPTGMSTSLGKLKRQRAAEENPGSLNRQKERRQQFEEDRAAASMEERAVRFDDRVSFQDAPSQVDDTDSDAMPVASSSHPVRDTAVPPPRSILKPTKPVKTITYDAWLWPCLYDGACKGTSTCEICRLTRKHKARPPWLRPDDAEDEAPGQTVSRTGLVWPSAGSAISDDGARRVALSSTVPPFPLGPTDEARVASVSWPAPTPELPLVCGPDAPSGARDYLLGREAGTLAGHATTPEEDEAMEDAWEVEAMLYSQE